MRKNLVSSVVAASLLLGSTAAFAETRPSATRFSQPATAAKTSAADGDTDYAKLFLIGGGSILAIWALIEAFKENSPKAPNA